MNNLQLRQIIKVMGDLPEHMTDGASERTSFYKIKEIGGLSFDVLKVKRGIGGIAES